MTVPGVNVICAASFLAAIGDVRRFRSSRALVAYLGLDPRVRQSGTEPARCGRISKRGSASARWALVEAAWSVVRQPGPLHAFYERIRARRGHGKAVVAAARKLAVPVLVPAHPRRGLRPPAAVADRQEAAPARDPRRRPDAQGQAHRRPGPPASGCARQSASSPSRPRPPTSGWSRTGKRPGRRRPSQRDRGGGRERDTGARIIKALEGQPRAADHEPLTSAL